MFRFASPRLYVKGFNKRSKIQIQDYHSFLDATKWRDDTSYSNFSFSFFHSLGNGLIDETEFLQWIARIQALRETDTTAEDDDLTQDLVAAFRYVVWILIFVKFFK